MSKVYVVTGGTAGIGAAIVKRILSSSKTGDMIIVNYGHNDDKARCFLESLDNSDQKKVALLKADLSTYDSMKFFVNSVLAQVEGKIDYLVCNVGVGTNIGKESFVNFSEYTFEGWNYVINTNLSIPVFLVKEFMGFMIPGGSVLLMSSFSGIRPHSSSAVYCISKAGLAFAAETLVKELEPKGLRINAITPGFTETDWHKDRSEESRNRINKKIALHRFGLPEEIADIAYAVMTNTYMNGSIIDIHGGYNYF